MNTFLFDLDGTLLPMDQNAFIKAYFGELTNRFTTFGIETEKLTGAIWAGTKAMVQNNGEMTNEKRFWQTFSELLGEKAAELADDFELFYKTHFKKLFDYTTPSPLSPLCVKALKSKGYTLALATNPVFPKTATLERMRWAGLEPEDFEHITTYENCSYAKPSLDYYKSILTQLSKQPAECVMVGNDIEEDMCARNIGIKAVLLSDCKLGNDCDEKADYEVYSFQQFYDFVLSLPPVN